ncbi:MAG: small multi-drug export protein [Lagierella massiliensis]|nr:small multi-drug export protein [Lagierella massiliensis]
MENFIIVVEKLLPKELAVFFLGMVPLIELKGAIPIGVSIGLSGFESLVYGYFGSFLPCPIIIFILNYILNKLRTVSTFEPYIILLERRLTRKGKNVEKLGLLGLLIFVSIPLPGTGVWSGSLIAGLFKLDSRKSLFVIMLGNLIAGIIVTLLTVGIKNLV